MTTWTHNMMRIFTATNIFLCIIYILIWFKIFDKYINSDFTAFYTGFTIIKEGLGSTLYDIETQSLFQNKILNGSSFKDGLLPCINPPHIIAIFFPLSYLPLKYSYILFSSLNLICLLCIILSININFNLFTRSQKVLIFSILISLFSTFYTLILGQFSIIILLSILQFYLSFQHNKKFEAGIWISITTIKPHFTLVFLVMLIVTKNWRSLLGLFSVTIPLVIITSFLLGINIWIEYYKLLINFSAYFNYMGVYPSAMYNFKNILYNLLGSDHVYTILFISDLGYLLTLSFIALLWRFYMHSYYSQFDLYFTLTLLMMVLFSPHLNAHDLTIIYLPIILIISHFIKNTYSAHYIIIFSTLPFLWYLTEFVLKLRYIIKIPSLILVILTIGVCMMLYHSESPNPSRTI